MPRANSKTARIKRFALELAGALESPRHKVHVVDRFDAAQAIFERKECEQDLVFMHGAAAMAAALDGMCIHPEMRTSPARMVLVRSKSKCLTFAVPQSLRVEEVLTRTKHWVEREVDAAGAECRVCLMDGLETSNKYTCCNCFSSVCLSCFALTTRSTMATRGSDMVFVCPTCQDREVGAVCFHRMQLQMTDVFPTAGAALKCSLATLPGIPGQDGIGLVVFGWHAAARRLNVFSVTMGLNEEGKLWMETPHMRQVAAFLRTSGTTFVVGHLPHKGSGTEDDPDRPLALIGRGFTVEDGGVVRELKHGFEALIGCFYSQ